MTATMGEVEGVSDLLTAACASRDDIAPDEMLTEYIRRRSRDQLAKLEADFEARTEPAAITAAQRELRDAFRDTIGGLPDRVPLEPVLVDRIHHTGVIVEPIRFTSRPGESVTATVFRPDPTDWSPPYPAVVVACGHAAAGKATDLYQQAAQLLARNGILAMVFDPVCQGERVQLVGRDGIERTGTPTRGHMLLGVGGIPLGRSVDRTIIWDGIRAIDYLCSRDDVDPGRIGMTGNSGGGTQTAYVGAIDDRVVAAAPSCYLTSFDALLEERVAEDVEQNVFNQLGFGLDHAGFIAARAPAPTLICAATDDFFPIDGTWETVRRATRLYGRLGRPERLSVVEVDGGHGYHRLLRETVVQWMIRWLRDEDRPVDEPANVVALDESTVAATPDGYAVWLPGDRTRYDALASHADTLAEQRTPVDDGELAATIASRIGIAGVPDVTVPEIDTLAEWTAGNASAAALHVLVEPGSWCPAIHVAGSGRPTLVLTDDGFDGAEVADALDAGTHRLFLDLRGLGITSPDPTAASWDGEFGACHSEALAAYRLGESIVGMRVRDLLAATQWLVNATAAATVDVTAQGDVGIPALHAACLAPSLIESCTVTGMIRSWDELARTPGAAIGYDQLVFGALERYDLPDLITARPDAISVSDLRSPEPWDPADP